ncbi:hypothetical protein TNCV_1765591 [Trichonephila clavipes]|nr:hypothetical protein TNCV_1765591 [Trichonephila clavipes]
MFIFSKNGETTLVLPNTLWKPTLASRAAKKWENWSRAMLLSSSPPFSWGRSLGCSQWCPAEGTGITHIQVLQQTLQEVKLIPQRVFSGQCIGLMEHTSGT